MNSKKLEELEAWVDKVPDAITRRNIEDLLTEVRRLRGCLKRANESTEHFEREYYLLLHAQESGNG